MSEKPYKVVACGNGWQVVPGIDGPHSALWFEGSVAADRVRDLANLAHAARQPEIDKLVKERDEASIEAADYRKLYEDSDIEAKALTAKLRAAETALVAVEWGGTEEDEDGADVCACPWCGEPQDMGHTSRCELAEVIALIRSPAPLTAEQIDEAIHANFAEGERLRVMLKAALPPDTGGGQMATEPHGEANGKAR